MKDDFDMQGGENTTTEVDRSIDPVENRVSSRRRPADTITVLVIDDDPAIGRMIEKAMGDEARVLQEYGLPEEGSYDFESLDCVVLDYRMPIRNGLEILKEIRSVYTDLPVIFLTGFGDLELVENALELGANKFVSKPISPLAVKHLVLDLAVESSIISRGTDRELPKHAEKRDERPEISRQFVASRSDNASLAGEIIRFGTRAAYVEFSSDVELIPGEKLHGISFRFGRLQVESGQGIVCNFQELADDSIEAEILVPEIWGVIERRQGADGEEIDQGNTISSSMPAETKVRTERVSLDPAFRLSVHELVGVLQAVEQAASSFRRNANLATPTIESFREETRFVETTSDQFAPEFWEAIRGFEHHAARIESIEEQILAKEYARKHLYPFALSSPFLARVVEKPIGVPGDFGMLGKILGNPMEGYSAYDRIFNSWILKCGAADAYRNRVDLLSREICCSVNAAMAEGRRTSILSMASGVAYEVQRYIENPIEGGEVNFTLVDFSSETLAEAERQYRMLGRYPDGISLELHRSSVLDLANVARGGATEPDVGGYEPESEYDLVYCAGLFDYLSDRLIARVTKYLFSLVRPGGKVVVSNYTDLNPIKAWMTMVMDWELIYRSASDFEEIMKKSLPEANILIETDNAGVEVYALIRN